ncbi:hypothetical protein ACQP1G_31450 [Nocardia sp. CA-107356]|uniref:hypothetical protein n=1 Tax=Nocardia sp. CA-107356 TaxID=3239972 RepID=UPI003D8EA44B
MQAPRRCRLTRIAHHWQDNARAWLMPGRPDRALAALNKARAAAPQLHPSVRETLFGIAMAQRRQTDSLLGFASWLRSTLQPTKDTVAVQNRAIMHGSRPYLSPQRGKSFDAFHDSERAAEPSWIHNLDRAELSGTVE